MKFPKPFFRKAKNAWYVQIGKRQHSLGRDQEKAMRRYRELMLHEGVQPHDALSSLTVVEIFDLFLEWAKNRLESYDWYRRYLQDFTNLYGAVKAAALKPFHVTHWLAAKKWSDTTQNKVVGILQRALNWGLDQGLIAVNPIRRYQKPRCHRRERILTIDERQEVLNAARGRAFKELVTALQETGARPGEVRKLTRDNVDLARGIWILTKHKTVKKTGRPRIIYLTPTMLDMTKRLMVRFPSGPLFRNSRCAPWTQNAIRQRFRHLRQKLPHLKSVVAYTYRHTFTTDGLENGVPIATMAELLGHADTSMISAHYSHLSQKGDHLREAVLRVTAQPVPANASGPAAVAAR